MKNFKSSLASWLEEVWYVRKNPPLGLIILSWLYRIVIGLRQGCYRFGLRRVGRLPVPVIVVGNISVGGTGKTPLTIWLARFLLDAGFKPGIVSRGYGGTASQWPQPVHADSDFRMVGDEPLVIVRHTGCPMVVGPDRVAAAKSLLEKHTCDVIISDDGLQHYALGRDIEIAVVDSERRYGNGYCIPAGPLREPLARMNEIDLTVYNGEFAHSEYSMEIRGTTAVNLCDSAVEKELSNFSKEKVHVVTGIGNPQRFFKQIEREGLDFDIRQFPDHHGYNGEDIFYNDDRAILMTEKDAVKCRALATERHWYVPVKAVLEKKFGEMVLTLLAGYFNGWKTT